MLNQHEQIFHMKVAAAKAAKIQKRIFENTIEVQHKGDIDVVTQADIESQKAILEYLKGHFPQFTYIAEESDFRAQDLNSDKPTFIIDPLDGTSNFSKKLPHFAVSIALKLNKHIECGVIYNSATDDVYHAIKGQGAYKNDLKLQVSMTNSLNESFLETGFPYDRRESDNNNFKEFVHLQKKTFITRCLGAAALSLAYVAEGISDGFWEPKLKPWDIAAGTLLVQEAGGTVSDYSNQNLENNLNVQEIIASNALIHDELLNEIKESA